MCLSQVVAGVGAMGNCVSVKLLLGWELWVTVSQSSCCWDGCHGRLCLSQVVAGVEAMGNCVSVKLLLGWVPWVTVSQSSCCWGGGYG